MSKYQKLCVIVLVITILSGQFKFSRINESYKKFWIFDEVRIIFISALTLLLFPLYREYKVYNKNNLKRSKKLLIMLILFHLYFSLSYFWSPKNAYSRDVLYSLIILQFLLIYTYMIFNYNCPQAIKFLIFMFFVASILFSIGGLVFQESFQQQRLRLSFLWGGPNAYARLLYAGTIICVFYLLKSSKLYYVIIATILIITAILTGSRGATLAFVFLLPFLIIFTEKRLKSLNVMLLTFSILIILFTISPFNAYIELLKLRYPLTYAQLVNQYERNLRSSLFANAYDTFIKYPIFGVGIGGYFSMYSATYPHNILLNIMAEGGIIGLVFLVMIMFNYLYIFKQRTLLEAKCCFLVSLYYFFGSLSSGSYFDWRYIWIFLILQIILIDYEKDEIQGACATKSV